MAAIHADLRLWAGDRPADPPPADPIEAASRLYARESFRSPPRDQSLEPFTAAWFEQIEQQRYARHGYWIPKILEFKRHAGETLLGLGDGLGTDWLQYARHGTNVTACHSSQDQLSLMRRNFELHGQSGRFLHAPPHGLPLDAASIDVVCVHGLLATVDRPAAVIDEVYRVLRPGGKVIVVAPAKYDATFWYNTFVPWRRWLGERRPDAPTCRMTGRGMRKTFSRFVEHRIYKRHLRRSNLPPLWRMYPLPLLERLVGQWLIMKAFKPLSVALASTSSSVALAA
jgi:ubiquinone/menaquinone biosynthesis C-methylase UbiE